ncbi:hypothetical protein Droror1_Dr00026447 [Drosera rotundifolia]
MSRGLGLEKGKLQYSHSAQIHLLSSIDFDNGGSQGGRDGEGKAMRDDVVVVVEMWREGKDEEGPEGEDMGLCRIIKWSDASRPHRRCTVVYSSNSFDKAAISSLLLLADDDQGAE